MSHLYYRCAAALALLAVSVCMAAIHNEVDSQTCCVDEEFEARMYLDFGTVFIDSNTAFAYQNGTVHVAYSLPVRKVYMQIVGMELSPLIPKPEPMNTTLLMDYDNGIQYTVTAEGCQKSQLENNMTRQCIPAHAELISAGAFGEGSLPRPVTTYRYNSGSDVPTQITATVYKHDLQPITPVPCDPVHVTYVMKSANPDSGSLYSMSVLDIGPVVSRDIFDIPDACRH